MYMHTIVLHFTYCTEEFESSERRSTGTCTCLQPTARDIWEKDWYDNELAQNRRKWRAAVPMQSALADDVDRNLNLSRKQHFHDPKSTMLLYMDSMRSRKQSLFNSPEHVHVCDQIGPEEEAE